MTLQTSNSTNSTPARATPDEPYASSPIQETMTKSPPVPESAPACDPLTEENATTDAEDPAIEEEYQWLDCQDSNDFSTLWSEIGQGAQHASDNGNDADSEGDSDESDTTADSEEALDFFTPPVTPSSACTSVHGSLMLLEALTLEDPGSWSQGNTSRVIVSAHAGHESGCFRGPHGELLDQRGRRMLGPRGTLLIDSTNALPRGIVREGVFVKEIPIQPQGLGPSGTVIIDLPDSDD